MSWLSLDISLGKKKKRREGDPFLHSQRGRGKRGSSFEAFRHGGFQKNPFLLLKKGNTIRGEETGSAATPS